MVLDEDKDEDEAWSDGERSWIEENILPNEEKDTLPPEVCEYDEYCLGAVCPYEEEEVHDDPHVGTDVGET